MRNGKSTGKRNPLDGAYFHFLGLRPGESDPSAIRSAASAMSGSIGDCEGQHGLEGLIDRRSQIALATYRLLDPRRRDSFLERVQLSYPVYHEERKTEIQDLDLKQSRHPNPWIVPKRSEGGASSDQSELMNRPVIERAIREKARNPFASQAASDTMSWTEERREVVRSLRESESPASSFPISWIRSVLGW